MTPIEILKAARKLLTNPDHWTFGAMARDLDGEQVVPHSNAAACYCSVGAVYKVSGAAQQVPQTHPAEQVLRMLDKTATQLGHVQDWREDLRPCADLNDSKGHAAALEMFDLTISRLEAQGHE